ncbi:transcription factor bHLH30-like [Lycium ferocissimum]|uniref:transcription factor bHLH30-like n=1 Tax=Lycium ferocissimum TaxID=112874 RepID=UPI002815697F|nr:transcription factor bHLH30-like [Lycium ferocissimum]XP_059308711.1 transcription factor bHLH30-like [Lycium ferocissimum]
MQSQSSTDAYNMYGAGNMSGLIFQENSPWSLPQSFNTLDDPFLFPPSHYGGLFNRIRPPSTLQFPCSSTPFGLQDEVQKMSAQEIMDAKALAASKSHSEAERRRRERINNHLAKLRSLLPSTTKTDKASLLAEVIQHVKELKRQTSQISETNPVIPTEINELTVEYYNASDEEGNFVIKASLCCEDRPDLLPDLIKTLKSLRLKTLKAEITTLGGRVKNVLFMTRDQEDTWTNDNEDDQLQYTLSSIQEALKAVMERSSGIDSGSGNVKRQRTSNNINIFENRSL